MFDSFQLHDHIQLLGILYYLIIILSRNLYIIFHSKNCTTSEQRIKNTIHLIKYKLHPHLKKIRNIVLICVVVIAIKNQIPHDLEIYFIDVGQGDSTLILTPKDKTILIDGGGATNYDVGANTLIPYLLARKVKKLDYVIISHFDQDHVRRDFKCLKRHGG